MTFDIKAVQAYFKNIVSELQAVYVEKGFEPFKKPLMFSLPGILIAYFAIYNPSVSKLKTLKYQAKTLEALSNYYNDYSDSKRTMSGYNARMPLYKDKDEWLSYILTSTARKNGITFESLSAQTQNEMDNFMVVSREVSVSSDYKTVGAWLADIENSPIYLQITNMQLKRDSNQMGKVHVTLKLSTIFSKGGGA